MKDRFIELVRKIDEIEKLFHRTAPNTGFSATGIDKIYDVQKFQLWLQEVILEVQDIVNRTGDDFALDTLQTLMSSFIGWDDRRDFNTITLLKTVSQKRL